MAHAACQSAKRLNARLILAQTLTGRTARLAAQFRPNTPIVAVTSLESTHRALSLVWGVEALLLLGYDHDFRATTSQAVRFLAEESRVATGDLLVVSAEVPVGGGTNVLKVEVVGAVSP